MSSHRPCSLGQPRYGHGRGCELLSPAVICASNFANFRESSASSCTFKFDSSTVFSRCFALRLPIPNLWQAFLPFFANCWTKARSFSWRPVRHNRSSFHCPARTQVLLWYVDQMPAWVQSRPWSNKLSKVTPLVCFRFSAKPRYSMQLQQLALISSCSQAVRKNKRTASRVTIVELHKLSQAPFWICTDSFSSSNSFAFVSF